MVQHLWSNKCCSCCSTNVEQCIMWCWTLKYAVQHVESCWTKIELGSIPFNKLPQQCSTFVDQQKLNNVELCIICFRVLFNWVLKVNCASCFSFALCALWLGSKTCTTSSTYENAKAKPLQLAHVHFSVLYASYIIVIASNSGWLITLFQSVVTGWSIIALVLTLNWNLLLLQKWHLKFIHRKIVCCLF